MSIPPLMKRFFNVRAALVVTMVLPQYLVAQDSADTIKPNIILIVTDDQGYADVGFRGSAIQTPNIDELAKGGVVLNRFYTCPVCSPTRAGLMTGCYPIRFGMQRAVNRPNSTVGLPEKMAILPAALGKAGYKNRHIVGKWHLGNMRKSQLPLSHGFTTQYGPYCSGLDYFKHCRMQVHDFHRNESTVKKEGYYTDLLSDEAVRIIKKHEGDSPFFLYLPYGAPHNPLQAPDAEIERYKHLGDKDKATYAAMVAIIDQGVGRILNALDETGHSDHTLIVFISDNGGQKNADNRPLRGGKGDMYEGGIRVIAVARWPSRIPTGSTCEKRCSYIDMLPTFLDAANFSSTEMVKGFDGQSVLPLWKAKPGEVKEEPFYSFYESRNREKLAVIDGDWKLIRRGVPILESKESKTPEIELYNIAKDMGEQNNLASKHPERVNTLLAKLVAFRKLRPEGGVPPMVEPFPSGWKPPENWEPEE